MTQKEKAKAYDEAREKIAVRFGINVAEEIFSEFEDSEDERISKEIIKYVKDQQSTFISAPDCRDKYEEEENNKYNSWIAWLEKQGKQGFDWSDEDEEMLKEIISDVKYEGYNNNLQAYSYRKINWLKSIKQKIK